MDGNKSEKSIKKRRRRGRKEKNNFHLILLIIFFVSRENESRRGEKESIKRKKSSLSSIPGASSVVTLKCVVIFLSSFIKINAMKSDSWKTIKRSEQ